MSDSKFEYIDDVILDVDKDRVEKKEKISGKAVGITNIRSGYSLVWCKLY